MAIGIAEAKSYVTGNDRLVAIISYAGAGLVVCDQVSFKASHADSALHDNADAGLFTLSGQCGDSLPAAITAIGVLLYFCGGGSGLAQGKIGRSA